MNDPIADNQTELTIATLNSREDGDPVLNRAVAAILLALTKQSSELARQSEKLMQLERNLWKPNDLENLIDKRHLSACKECPTRKMVELWEAERQAAVKAHVKADKPSFWSYLFSKDGLMVIVVLLFALLCIRFMVGQQGYQDITSTVPIPGVQK